MEKIYLTRYSLTNNSILEVEGRPYHTEGTNNIWYEYRNANGCWSLVLLGVECFLTRMDAIKNLQKQREKYIEAHNRRIEKLDKIIAENMELIKGTE